MADAGRNRLIALAVVAVLLIVSGVAFLRHRPTPAEQIANTLNGVFRATRDGDADALEQYLDPAYHGLAGSRQELIRKGRRILMALRISDYHPGNQELTVSGDSAHLELQFYISIRSTEIARKVGQDIHYDTPADAPLHGTIDFKLTEGTWRIIYFQSPEVPEEYMDAF